MISAVVNICPDFLTVPFVFVFEFVSVIMCLYDDDQYGEGEFLGDGTRMSGISCRSIVRDSPNTALSGVVPRIHQTQGGH